jgi:DNA-binding transcriptional ArsR family regulator
VCRRFESCRGRSRSRLASDIIHYTRTTPPPLLPLFRSEHQLHLLGELFVYAGEARSISELSTATGIPQATVSREVGRLEEAGLLRSVRRGRLRLVEANDQLPYYPELRVLLLKTIGPAPVLAHELGAVKGIDEAFIFGSWAARYHGEPGPSPRDIDLMVIGEPDLDAIYAACRRAEASIRLDVNPIVRSRTEWRRRGSGFLADVRKGPLVQVSGRP